MKQSAEIDEAPHLLVLWSHSMIYDKRVGG